MKRIKRLGYIVLIVIILVLSLTVYTSASKNDEKNQKEKIFSEIQFLETKMVNLFNTMNHIEIRNYSIVTSQLSKESTEKSSSDSNSSKSSGSKEESSKDSSEGSSSNNSSQEKADESESKNKKFQLKPNSILNNTQDVDWEYIKNEVEILYTSIPSITMDLYQSNINQEDILSFNTEYDRLTIVVQEEKKQEVLEELTKLYDYLPKFLRGSNQEDVYTTLIETKNYILKAYAKLEQENWQEISSDVKNSIDIYSKLLTSTQVDTRKQYNISKTYVMLNELQNTINSQNTSVFLIKYKNLLEEINNI